jgi:hypothetical protein
MRRPQCSTPHVQRWGPQSATVRAMGACLGRVAVAHAVVRAIEGRAWLRCVLAAMYRLVYVRFSAACVRRCAWDWAPWIVCVRLSAACARRCALIARLHGVGQWCMLAAHVRGGLCGISATGGNHSTPLRPSSPPPPPPPPFPHAGPLPPVAEGEMVSTPGASAIERDARAAMAAAGVGAGGDDGGSGGGGHVAVRRLIPSRSIAGERSAVTRGQVTATSPSFPPTHPHPRRR